MNGHALKLSQAFGYLHEWEVHALQVAVQDRVQACNGKPVIVNIGSGAGTSGLSIIEAGADHHFVFTVDISEGGPLGGLLNEQIAFKNAGIPHKLPNEILGDSSEVGRSWNGEKLDLLFIDGDHSEAGLRADIAAWLPHVKPGGWVLFHDYTSIHWADVVKVVDEVMKDYPIAFSLDTLHARRVPG